MDIVAKINYGDLLEVKIEDSSGLMIITRPSSAVKALSSVIALGPDELRDMIHLANMCGWDTEV